jgi:hypothetical protein
MYFKLKLYIEFLLLFILLPISLAFEYNKLLKLCFIFLGGVYIITYLIKKKLIHLVKAGINWKVFFKLIAPHFLVLVILSTAYIYYFKKDNFF